MERGKIPAAPPLEIIPYQPEASRVTDSRERWEKYADKIVAGLGSATSDTALAFVASLPLARSPGEDTIEAVKRLGEDAVRDTNKFTSRYKCVLVATVCNLLYELGYNTSGEVDQALGSISESMAPRYLDTLRRGARTASEITIEWAAKYGNASDPRLISMTSSAAYQACLSIAHWSILAKFKHDTKARILAHPLPSILAADPLPLLAPSIIELIANGQISLPYICRCLGYSEEFAFRSASISQQYKTALPHAPVLAPPRKVEWTFAELGPLFFGRWVNLHQATLTKPLMHPSQAEDDALQG